MFKNLLASFFTFAATDAASRSTWGGLYQPKSPKSLLKKIVSNDYNDLSIMKGSKLSRGFKKE